MTRRERCRFLGPQRSKINKDILNRTYAGVSHFSAKYHIQVQPKIELYHMADRAMECESVKVRNKCFGHR